MGSWCTSLESVVDSGRGYEESMPILKKAGFESVGDLQRTAVGFRSNAYQDLPPQLRLFATVTLNGE